MADYFDQVFEQLAEKLKGMSDEEINHLAEQFAQHSSPEQFKAEAMKGPEVVQGESGQGFLPQNPGAAVVNQPPSTQSVFGDTTTPNQGTDWGTLLQALQPVQGPAPYNPSPHAYGVVPGLGQGNNVTPVMPQVAPAQVRQLALAELLRGGR